MRKFRLLKDLLIYDPKAFSPDIPEGIDWRGEIKAGALFQKTGSLTYSTLINGRVFYLLHTIVENNPDWFEEVLDEQPKGPRKAFAYVWGESKAFWRLSDRVYMSKSEAEFLNSGHNPSCIQWPAVPDPDGFYPGPR